MWKIMETIYVLFWPTECAYILMKPSLLDKFSCLCLWTCSQPSLIICFALQCELMWYEIMIIIIADCGALVLLIVASSRMTVVRFLEQTLVMS